MGAFFFQKDSKTIPNGVLDVFHRKGFNVPVAVNAGNSLLLYFPKQLAEFEGVFCSAGASVVSVGTCFYRNNTPADSLKLLHKDWLDDRLETSKLVGNFVLLFVHGNHIAICGDRIGQYSFYFEEKSGTVSSSFLATVKAASVHGKLRVNRANITEVLLTGTGFGKDTMVEGIQRWTPGNGIPFLEMIQHEKSEIFEPTASTLDGQIELFDRYFKGYAKLFDITGVVSGITGGFDSRLLYLILRRHTSNLKTFTNTYNMESAECSCAISFANSAKADFRCLCPEKPEEMDTDEFREMIRDGFYFWDGVCRLHHLWLEKRKSRNFLTEIYDSVSAGVSGVGGERFRIHDGLVSSKYPVKLWIENEILSGVCGNVLLDNKEGLHFRNSFHRKIRLLAGVADQEKKISLKRIRSFYNVVYNTANRTQRSTIENQLVFFFSPFVEPGIDAINLEYLLKHRFFELELIKELGHELKDCMTSYGYSPARPKLFRERALFALKGKYLFNYFHGFRQFARKSNGGFMNRLVNRHPFLRDYIERVEYLNLPVNSQTLCSNDALFPILLQAGMFLAEMEDCLNVD